jgi:hypothetical protein
VAGAGPAPAAIGSKGLRPVRSAYFCCVQGSLFVLSVVCRTFMIEGASALAQAADRSALPARPVSLAASCAIRKSVSDEAWD